MIVIYVLFSQSTIKITFCQIDIDLNEILCYINQLLFYNIISKNGGGKVTVLNNLLLVVWMVGWPIINYFGFCEVALKLTMAGIHELHIMEMISVAVMISVFVYVAVADHIAKSMTKNKEGSTEGEG